MDQTVRRLRAAGIRHGARQGDRKTGHYYGWKENVHVWSMQTLERVQDIVAVLKQYDLVIYDEGHAIRRAIVEGIVAAGVRCIALSATPFTRGLGKIYTNLVNVRSTDQLVKDGWLIQPRIFCGTPINMDGAAVTGGEWSAETAAERALPVIGDVVSEYVRHTNMVFGGPVLTFGFGNTVADCREYAAQFNSIGITTEVVSYRDRDDKERSDKFERFRYGDTTILFSVEALGRGIDVPEVLCLIDARPYRKNVAGVIQKHGRIMRPATGKTQALVIDPARNYLRFALAIEDFYANGVQALDDRKMKEMRKPGDPDEIKQRICGDCQYVLPAGARECPACGWTVPRPRSKTAVVAGNFTEYKRAFEGIGDIWPHICRFSMDRFPGDHEMASKRARGWYKDITGVWPRWGRPMQTCEVCDERISEALRALARKYIIRSRAIEKAIRKKQDREREEAIA